MAEQTEFTQVLKSKGYEIFFREYEEEAPVWPLLFEEEDCPDAYVMSHTMVGLDELIEKKPGEPIKYDTPEEGWLLIGKIRTFARGMRWNYETHRSMEAIAKLFSSTIKEWSRAAARTKESFYSKFFVYGALTAGHDIFDNSVGDIVDPSGKFIYDGKPFMADSGNEHPLKSATVAGCGQNYLGATKDYSIDNLNDAYTKMVVDNAYNDRGNPITIRPDTILCHPSIAHDIKADISSEYYPTKTSGASKKNPFYNMFGVLPWNRIPKVSTHFPWALLQRGRGLVALSGEEVVIDVWQDKENKEIKASVMVLFGGYVKDWRYTIGACFAKS